VAIGQYLKAPAQFEKSTKPQFWEFCQNFLGVDRCCHGDAHFKILWLSVNICGLQLNLKGTTTTTD